MMRPSASVVICAYSDQRAEALVEAARAVREQLTDRDELIVVVDHNARLLDSVRAALATGVRGDRRLTVIANVNERGLSGARNAGVSAAAGEVIAFLDDDAKPRPHWLSELLEPFDQADVIGVGGVALPAWESGPASWMPDEFLWVVGCSYRGLPQRPTEIRNPIGANMAFRHSVFTAVGGFTHGIGRVGRTPLGCEETELSVRAAREYGGRIVQQPSAVVDHAVPAERLRLGYFVRRCWAEGISKAIVARLAGAQAALASERTYTTRTLPVGVARGLWDGVRGDVGGFGRAAAITGGLSVTVAGYLRGSAAKLQPRPEPVAPDPEPDDAETGPAADGGFTPIWSGELALDQPWLPERLITDDGQAFTRARLLLRAGGTPLGFLEVETPGGHPDLHEITHRAEAEFGERARTARAERDWSVRGSEAITVILCTHDRSEGARRTLESLRTLPHPNLEIIVVDNAPSDDSTLRLVADLAASDPRIRYLYEPLKGLSRARNRGLSEARGDVVAFTDDDVRVDLLWLQGLMRGFARRPDVACVTGLVASGSLARPAEQYFDGRVWWSSSCEHRLYTSRRERRDSPLHPYAAGSLGTGANFAARTAVLRALGGFDAALGAGSPSRGGEDLDIFVRILTSGHSLSYEPSALVWHDHRIDEAALQQQMYAYGLGLTAYLTKQLMQSGTRGALLRRAVRGAWHALSLLVRSRQAGERASVGGSELVRTELAGMLMGPIAYLWGRRRR